MTKILFSTMKRTPSMKVHPRTDIAPAKNAAGRYCATPLPFDREYKEDAIGVP